MALIDSGAAGNLIDIEFAKYHDLPCVPCESWVAVAALDGHPLGNGQVKFITEDLRLQTGTLHSEIICLYPIESPQNPIILGLPWLEKHNPQISWKAKQISQWSEYWQKNCLLIDSYPLPLVPKPPRTASYCQIFPQTRPSQCLQPDFASMKGFLDNDWTLRISRYSVQIGQQSVSLSSLHQRCLPGHAESMGHCLY